MSKYVTFISGNLRGNHAPNPISTLNSPFLISFSLFTHEEGEVEEAEDVFGARGAAVGHHDEVEVPLVGCAQV